MFLRKTKIVATVGPSSSSKSVLKTMVQAGVDVFRLNFSHGDTVFYDKIIENIKNINKELHKHTAILADLQGQKIRIGKIKEGTFLEKNKTITITEKRIIGNSKKIQIKYKDLHKTLNKGKKISIDDGKIVLKIESKSLSKKEIKCRIINGGELKSNKGVNFEDETKNKGALSYKDKKSSMMGRIFNIDTPENFVVNVLKYISHLQNKKITHYKVYVEGVLLQAIRKLDSVLKNTDTDFNIVGRLKGGEYLIDIKIGKEKVS